MIHEKFPTSFYNVSEIIAHKKEVITHEKRIIAIRQNTKEDIIQLLHISPEKIDVIYHSTSMKLSLIHILRSLFLFHYVHIRSNFT